MWKFVTCGKISYKEKPNSHCFAVRSVLFPCMLCCRKICHFDIYAVFLQFTHFLCGEKLSPRFCPWRKNDKYNVWSCHDMGSPCAHIVRNDFPKGFSRRIGLDWSRRHYNHHHHHHYHHHYHYHHNNQQHHHFNNIINIITEGKIALTTTSLYLVAGPLLGPVLTMIGTIAICISKEEM